MKKYTIKDFQRDFPDDDTCLEWLVNHLYPDGIHYNTLQKSGYVHHRINHSAKVYVVGDIHTNTIEGFWSLVKRGISGVYHSVSAKYLQNYLDEYSFRYAHRRDVTPMFQTILGQVSQGHVYE